MASAAIVMADDGLGVWWPARLGTPAENEWFRKTYKIRTVRLLLAVCGIMTAGSTLTHQHQPPNE